MGIKHKEYIILSVCNTTGELWIKISNKYYIKRDGEKLIEVTAVDPFVSSRKPYRKE